MLSTEKIHELLDSKTEPRPGQRRIDRENTAWLETFNQFCAEWESGILGDNVSTDHPLYAWVENQRKRFRAEQMPQWKRIKLNGCHFPWEGKRHYASITDQRIRELLVHYDLYGHMIVNQRAPGCRRLALWIARLKLKPNDDILQRIRGVIPRFKWEDFDRFPPNRALLFAPIEHLLPTEWFPGDTSPYHCGWYQTARIEGQVDQILWYGANRQWSPSSTSKLALPSPNWWRGCVSALEMTAADLVDIPNLPGTKEWQQSGINIAHFTKVLKAIKRNVFPESATLKA